MRIYLFGLVLFLAACQTRSMKSDRETRAPAATKTCEGEWSPLAGKPGTALKATFVLNCNTSTCTIESLTFTNSNEPEKIENRSSSIVLRRDGAYSFSGAFEDAGRSWNYSISHSSQTSVVLKETDTQTRSTKTFYSTCKY